MASPARILSHNVARLKSLLPAQAYLHLLHQGAMTGFLPRFSPEGTPTGQFDNLSPKDRVDMARYLLDKVLPDAPKELALVAAPPAEDSLTDPKVLRHLSTEELRQIAYATPADVEVPDVNTQLVEVSAPGVGSP
jgi:hypothetical protein